ncbi:hypothetical protein N015_08290 [Pseudomonas asturiensis]|uniref:Transcriptional regulator, AlpA family n=1 Tax=Pseudomonas asturiensis TaxID=1190415 RepID=A0ABX6HA23_9PSED|nr:hypothetical protein [Pseudomonas asturiensis]QHF02410.1 hypothetical protein N015_08290 [Pseudomonas asturiensis]
MEKPQRTTLIGNQELRQMLGMQTQSGLNKLRNKDATFPKPIKTSDSRQARPRYDLAEIEEWIKSKKAARDDES